MNTPSIQTAEELEDGSTKGLENILEHRDNIAAAAEDLDIDLGVIAMDIEGIIQKDKASMSDWLKRYKEAVMLAKLEPEHAKKTFPFEGASNLVCSYVLEAAVDFSARATPAVLERQNICKAKIVGKERTIQYITTPDGREIEINQGNQQQIKQIAAQMQQQGQPIQPQSKLSTEKQDRADRVKTMINYDLTVGIKGWRDKVDQELYVLPIVGTTFKLTKQSAFENKRESYLIMPDKLFCDHSAQSFDEVQTKSFDYSMSKNDVVRAMNTGQFIEIDVDGYEKETTEVDFTESHTWLDLDDDGFSEPYIVTIEKQNSKIVSIVPRFDIDDIKLNKEKKVSEIKAEEFFTMKRFLNGFDGFMGAGWGMLLAPTFHAINTSTNQVVDGATLQNTGLSSGFIRSGGNSGARGGNRQRKGEISATMGSFTSIESSGTNPLSNDIVNFPFNGPSPVLFQFVEVLKQEARTLTQAAGVDAQPNEAAEMYLARLQQAMIKPNSIMVRVFSGLTDEIKRIYELQAEYLTQDEYFRILDDDQADWTKDYSSETLDISMTADPTQGSEQERIARTTLIKDQSLQNPALNARVAYGNWLEAIGVQDVDSLLAPVESGQPDPLQEMQAQAMQTMSEAEAMKGQAALMKAQNEQLRVQIEQQKLQAELDKLESESMKNLSEVDKNERDSLLKLQQQMKDNNIKDTQQLEERLKNDRQYELNKQASLRSDNESRLKGLVQPSSNSESDGNAQ